MKSRVRKIFAAAALASGVLFSAGNALASTCIGICGVIGVDGDVSAPSGMNHYVTTFGSSESNGGTLPTGPIGTETNGSTYTTTPFNADAGATLQFYYTYATSDGNTYNDYAWAALLDDTNAFVAYLFTARTTTSGDTVPGFNMPLVDAALDPTGAPILPGTGGLDPNTGFSNGPVWSPLGAGGSGLCYNIGCGLTDWIKSTFTIANAGIYSLAFGVTNWDDTQWDSGLAWYGATISSGEGQIEVDPVVPLPATLPLFAAGLGVMGLMARRKKRNAVIEGLTAT